MSTVIQQSDISQPVLDLMGTLTPEESRLALAVYQGIADEGLIGPDKLASISGQTTEEIDTYLNKIPGVFRDDHKNVIGFWGLTAAPVSHHQLIADGKTLYAWCAWDTLFLPALLDQAFTVTSKCQQTDATIELLVSPKEILKASSQDIVLSMLAPDESEFEQDVVASFCHLIHFFESMRSGQAWIADKQNIELITLEEAFELGVQKNIRQFNLSY